MVRKTTKEILAESFMELTATKPISKISIVDIVENCAMTKPTFYRYFKDKYDLMAWLFVRAAQSNVNKIGTDGYVWRDTLLDGLHHYEKNRKFMINALKHTSGRDAFINLINEADIAFIMDEIRKKLGSDDVPGHLAALVKIYCYGTGQYMCDWLMDSNPVSCEEMARTMEAAIPDELKPYLCE